MDHNSPNFRPPQICKITCNVHPGDVAHPSRTSNPSQRWANQDKLILGNDFSYKRRVDYWILICQRIQDKDIIISGIDIGTTVKEVVWSTFPLVTLIMLRPFSPELVVCSDFEFRTSLGTSILPLKHFYPSVLRGNVQQLTSKQFHKKGNISQLITYRLENNYIYFNSIQIENELHCH